MTMKKLLVPAFAALLAASPLALSSGIAQTESGRGTLEDQVNTKLAELGYSEVDTTQLTLDQLSQIKLLTDGEYSVEQVKMQIDDVLNIQ